MYTKQKAASASSEILIADDRLEHREWLKQILVKSGYKIRAVSFSGMMQELSTGRNPVAIFMRGQFLDECLEVCRQYGRDPLHAGIPIFIAGTEEYAKAVEKVLEAGAAEYFQWPVAESVFIQRLKLHLTMAAKENGKNPYAKKNPQENVVPDLVAETFNKHLKTFLETSVDVIFSLSPDGKLIYATENWKILLGHNPDEWIGKNVFEGLVHPDDISVCRAAIRYCIETRLKVTNIEYRIKALNGSWRWESTNASPIFAPDGTIESIIGIARDITELKQHQEELQRVEEGYLGLFNTVNEAIYVHDENGVFIDVNRGAEIMYGYERHEIVGKTPAFLSAPGKNDLDSLGEIMAFTFRTGLPRQFEFWGRRKNGEAFPKDVICNRGKYFGRDVLITTARDMTHHKKAEDLLKGSEEKFSKVFHISPDVVLLTRVKDGVIVDINNRVFDLSGFTREDVIGKTTIELEGWSDQKDRAEYISLLKKNGSVHNYEKTFKIKSGDIRYATISGEMVEIQGEQFIMTVIRDITDWKITQEKLKEESTKLQVLSDNLPDTVIYQLVFEPSGKLYLSHIGKGIENNTGYPPEYFMEDVNRLFDTVDDSQRAELRSRQIESCKNMTLFEMEVRQKKPDGNYCWLHLLSSPRKMDDGRVVWDGVQTDITAQKTAALKVQENEEKYRLLVENALDVIYTLDTNLKIKTINTAAEKVFGYKTDELIGQGAELILTEDQIELSRSMLNKKLDGVEQTRYEMVFTARDGHKIPMELQTRMLYRDGKFDGILGIARDITERKKSEEELQKLMRELSDYKYALDLSANVSISDENGTILYVNENFCKQYGYSVEEVVGQNHKILNSDYHPLSFWEGFWNTIQQGKVLKAEVRNKGKDGRFFWADSTVIPFLDQHGKPYQYVAIRRDITEKRRLEQELAAQQLHNQRLITEITIQEQEKEKTNISRELHENIIQILAGAKIYLGIAQTKTEKQDQMMAESYEYLNRAMDMIRNLSYSLVTPTLSDFGLVEALIDLAVETSKKGKVHVAVDNQTQEKIVLENKQVLLLYRIVQEQIDNIVRYARAESARIRIHTENDMLHLSVEDDGVGFDPASVKLGFGLTSIRNRVEFYGGRMIIISAPGKGCHLEILLPVRQNQVIPV